MKPIEEVAVVKSMVRIKPNVEGYVAGRSSKGAKVKISGDLVSQLLDGLTLEEAYDLAEKAVGTKNPTLRTKYTKLNPGHQRMCLGNLLRGVKTDEDKAQLSKMAEPFRKAADARQSVSKKVFEAKATERAEKAAAKALAKETGGEAAAKPTKADARVANSKPGPDGRIPMGKPAVAKK